MELPGRHAVPGSSSRSVLPSLVSVIVSSAVSRKQFVVPVIGPLTLVNSKVLVASPNPNTVPSPHWKWSQGFEAGTPKVLHRSLA
jgi:hypothetical protein